MTHDRKGDSPIYRCTAIDLAVDKPELKGDPTHPRPQHSRADGVVMFPYLDLEFGPIGGRSIEIRDRPPWPVRPLDLACMEAAAPRLDVLEQIRNILPGFSPDDDSRAWCSVVELVRSVGRSAEEARRMSYDELLFLLDVHGQRLRLERCDLESIVSGLVSSIAGVVRDKSRPPKRGKADGLPVDMRLKEFCRAAPTFCMEADLEDVAQILNCGVSSFYGGEFFETLLRPARDKKAKKAKPQEVFNSEKPSTGRARRSHEEEMNRVDARIDAEG